MVSQTRLGCFGRRYLLGREYVLGGAADTAHDTPAASVAVHAAALLGREQHVQRSVLVASSALFDVGGGTRLEIAPRFVTLSLFLPRFPLVVVVVVAAVGFAWILPGL